MLGALTVVAQPAAAVGAPSVTAVGPTTGPTAGGTRVTVIGTNFINVRSVHFGGYSGTSIHVVSSTKLLVTAPAHPARTIDVIVSTAQGTSALHAPDHFTYVAPPKVTSIGPATGSTAGGSRVTVNGSSFSNVTYVSFGTARGASIHVVGTTRLLVTAPAHAAGVVDLQVHTAYGISPTGAADHFTYVAPVQKVTGTVRAAGTGAPLAGVSVELTRIDDSTTLPAATTAADGSYTVSGLAADADYSVCFDARNVPSAPPGGYIPRCWDGSETPGAGLNNVIYVGTGQTRSGVDAALAIGGEITGTVRDRSGHPLAGVGVEVGSSEQVRTRSAADGTYRVTGVELGGQPVCFDGAGVSGGDSAHGYRRQCFPDDTSGYGGQPISVFAGQVTAGVDAAMYPVATISGTVTGPAGLGMAGVTVQVRNSSPVTTGSNGTYVATDWDRDTSEDICFTPKAPSPFAKRCTYVGAGLTTGLDQISHLDAHFGAPSVNTAITGFVKDPNGHPLADVEVDDGVLGITSTTTGADGSFTLSQVYDGDYPICFHTTDTTAPARLGGYLSGCTSDWVHVVAGQTTSGVQGTLAFGGAISGTITDTAGKPLAGVFVRVGGSAGGWQGYTDASGNYVATGLPPGDYTAAVSVEGVLGSYSLYTGGTSPTGYLDQCWQNVTPYDPCTHITVAAGASVSHIDMKLVAGAAVSGTVTDTSGHPLRGVAVVVSPYFKSTTTDINGHYTVIQVHPRNDIKVCFNPATVNYPPSAGGYRFQCWNNAADGTTAAAITTTSGQTTAGIDAHLTAVAIGSISGKVTDADGHPVAGIIVTSDTNPVRTAADGTYTLVDLPPGQHTVCFESAPSDTPSNSTGYQFRCYHDADLFGSPTPVTVVAGQTTTGIDQALPAGGQISGTVTDVHGTPLRNVEVQLNGPQQVGVGEVFTDAGGHYRIPNLTDGEFTLHFLPGRVTADAAGTYGYEPQWSGGVADQFSAVPITVTGGASATGDAVLVADGAISGKVIDYAGHPLPFTEVRVGNGVSFGGARTGADGTYVVTGLAPAADYTVCFDAPNTIEAPYGTYSGCYGDNAGTTSPASVTVTTFALTGGVNAVMARFGAIRVTVTDDQAHPLLRVEVVLHSTDPNFDGRTAYTDAEGTLTFPALGALTYSLQFEPVGAAGGDAQNYQWLTRNNVVVNGGQLTQVTQALQPSP